jgi:GrpB-like predicted nucleotidyltransferase (UPF0157 family)
MPAKKSQGAGSDLAVEALVSRIQLARGRRKLPLAFTERGALTAATVLNSSRATEVSVYVARAFIKLRDLLASNRELARRFADLERRLERRLATHDQAIAGILDAIRQLMHPPQSPKRAISVAMNRPGIAGDSKS